MNEVQTDVDRPAPSTGPRLERPEAGRWFAGVARGLSDDWGMPAWVVRLAFLILLPVGGLGLLLYGIGWVLIPGEGQPEPLVSRWVEQMRDRQAWLGAALVTVAAIIVLSSLNIVDDGLIWAGALLVLGFLLYRGDLGGLTPPPPRARPLEPEDRADEIEVPEVEPAIPDVADDLEFFADGADGPPPLTLPVEQPPRPPRPPREPSYLGRLTLGALLITIGVMVAFDVSGITNPTTRHYFAAPVLVIGIGLLVGTFFGRSRGLIVLGLLLAPLALVGSLLDISFGGEFGDIDVIADSPDDLEPRYRVAGGEIYLDLRQLELGGEDVAIEASVGGGRILVTLPTEYQVEIDSRARLGQLDILGRSSNGFSLERLVSRPGTDGTIRLNLDAGIGQVEVRDFTEFFDGFGVDGPTTVIRPLSIGELEPAYFLPNGTLELDLRELALLTEDGVLGVDLDAAVGRGDVIVLLPPWLNANIVARTGTGVLDLLGNQIAGVNLIDELTIDGGTGASLNLSLSAEEGTVVVIRP